MKEFKLTRKPQTVIEPVYKIGNAEYPQKFVDTANMLFKDLANKIGAYVVHLHDSESITLPECFDAFYVSEVFVRNRATIQVNFKSKSEPYMLLQTTYNRQGGVTAPKKLTFVVSVGRLHSENQSILSDSVIHTDICLQDDNVSIAIEPLQKMMVHVSKFLNDLEILNHYL